MTREQSQLLKIGDRVSWAGSTTDQGTVTAADWTGVVIKWDDRQVSAIAHNDMTGVNTATERARD